jgi:hypothetical protein
LRCYAALLCERNNNNNNSCHLYAYIVDITERSYVENYAKLVDLHPLSLMSAFGEYSSRNFVVLRHDIIDAETACGNIMKSRIDETKSCVHGNLGSTKPMMYSFSYELSFANRQHHHVLKFFW